MAASGRHQPAGRAAGTAMAKTLLATVAAAGQLLVAASQPRESLS
eukprot:COSAG01_NODE_38812_length_484_cov_25.909091_1_plen_44_part_01